MNQNKEIAVLITCHNRAKTTISCLSSLFASTLPRDFSIKVYLTDDGSTDGTSRLIESMFPSVTIIQGDGLLYWNRGMHTCWKYAINRKHDFYLLLNDDVELAPNSISNLVILYYNSNKMSVVVGKTIDPISGLVTYGALKRKSRISRNSFIPITTPMDVAVTFNANCILIPNSAIESVGILDPFYTQQFGDIDLGLRFSSYDWAIVELGQPVAVLAKNYAYTHANFILSYKEFMNLLQDPKGIPWKEWWHFLYKFNGFLAPLYFSLRYFKIVTLGARNRIRK